MQTMTEQRLDTFVQWGSRLDNEIEAARNQEPESPLYNAISRAYAENAWFTPENSIKAVSAIAAQLKEQPLKQWLEPYQENTSFKSSQVVGIVAAGNVPCVAFHDVLCVLATGHRAEVKLSSQDRVLLPALMTQLAFVNKQLADRVSFVDRLTSYNAVIATGSSNTGRYFEYYFSNVPRIIRGNRNSVAVLTGNETESELAGLAEDIFLYFGLGCRNVTQLLIPPSYHLDVLFGAFYPWADRLVSHNKYMNNYDYHKAIWLLNGDDLLENGFLLMRESDALASPVGSLFYKRVNNEQEGQDYLMANQERIQCVVGTHRTPFGSAQQPHLWDYADGVDTVKFLLALSQGTNSKQPAAGGLANGT